MFQLNSIATNLFPVTFYSSSSSLRLNVSLKKGTLQLNISEALDKNKKVLAKKGERRYDHENSLNFSLNLREIVEIIRNMKKLISGNYKRHRKDSQGNDVVLDYMEFYHTVRTLTIKRYSDELISLNLVDSEKNKSLYYVLNINSNDFYLFMNILKSFVQFVPMFSMITVSLNRLIYWLNSSNNNFQTNFKKKDNIQSANNFNKIPLDELFSDNSESAKDKEDDIDIGIDSDDDW